LRRLRQLLLVRGFEEAGEPTLEDFHPGDDRDRQLLIFLHRLDPLAELLILAVGEERHDVGVEDDQPPAFRRAPASVSLSSRSSSSRKTPNCLSTACFEPAFGDAEACCFNRCSRRTSSINNNSSANGDSSGQCGGNIMRSPNGRPL